MPILAKPLPFLLLAVLVLAAPGLAQPPSDPGSDPGPPSDPGSHPGPPSDPGSHPGPPSDPGSDPGPPADPGSDPGPPADPGRDPDPETPPEEPSQNQSAASASPSPEGSTQESLVCRVVANHIGDRSVPLSQWIIPDPDGCLRDHANRVLKLPQPR